MSQNDEAFLMSSEVEDGLVVEEELDENEPHPSTSTNILNQDDVESEMNRILSTPWYELNQDQTDVIQRLVSISENNQIDHADLRNSIENALIELATIRWRNAQIAQKHISQCLMTSESVSLPRQSMASSSPHTVAFYSNS
ncbi:Biogenesis of lysosome-related organelles complex 1 subunit 7 [Caenorhabditis elegans]|uniref:Biogenesis of lysosome-related organelles complex 1 subunit 7 n=1 Tax=Caenorhabditis elegans TaxID=6239 RepID=E3CTH8_CAEEL|nr:Biogenesis of lysosome-related organelles complex 1 subunit 7 [Caenorhabditis elegans]CBX53349.1 Biogenesis of lysosome-related organelles complex 1 subunit 7 [Caenorhabditis elegans]|eukprot:NP_001257178.1 Uncharacterized protein CELE_Y62H9A.15 [Caenorhabditis elegans]